MIGSSLASLGLYLAFHHLGWDLLLDWYPDIAKSKLWSDSTRWLSEYGVVALFVLMAVPLPLPKTPALAFVAIYRMPIYEVALAIGFGKLLKYLFYAYVVARFPAYFSRLYAPALPRAPTIGEADAAGASAGSLRKIEIRHWWWARRVRR